MIILVCGGRDYNDVSQVYATLNYYRDQIKLLITGNATGADNLAEVWADDYGVPNQIYPADWKKYGKSAGPIRNREMLEKHPDVDLVIAFPGGSGTRDMMTRAKNRGIKVQEILPRGGRSVKKASRIQGSSSEDRQGRGH